MSPRGFLVVGVLVVATISGVLVYRRGSAQPTATPPSTSGSSMTEQEKSNVRLFWETYRVARAHKLAGEWEEAIPVYEKALELDPEHEDTLYNLANCHFELDQFPPALEHLERLAEVNSMSSRAFLQIGTLRSYPVAEEVFDLAAAEKALLRAFDLNKEETGGLLQLGELAIVQGEEDLALERLALANQSNFRAVEGYYLRGYLRWKGGETENALELLREAVTQSRKPKVVVAEVPGEGDTKPGSLLPPTTLEAKRLIPPRWTELLERYPEEEPGPDALDAEFAPVKAYLDDLRARIARAVESG